MLILKEWNCGRHLNVAWGVKSIVGFSTFGYCAKSDDVRSLRQLLILLQVFKCTQTYSSHPSLVFLFYFSAH